MDFLDPKKEKRNHFYLLIGYCLIALAIGIATLVLLYQSYGYNVNSDGDVTQNGLVFVSSQPSGAAIYLNGIRYKSNTDSRVLVPADTYTLRISAPGYRPWVRPIVVNGGDVQHFDYPFLFPTQLKTTVTAELNTDPSIALQSPDKRWLLLGQSESSGSFTQYDLKNPAKPIETELSLPAETFTPGTGAQSWELVEWAADNKHVLLLHSFAGANGINHEYILLNRDDPATSVNLSNSLNLDQTQTLNLFDNRTSQFYVYAPGDHTLSRINGSDGSVVSKLEHVLAFKTYADNKILYVTDVAPSGKTTPGQVSVVLLDGQKTYTLRTLPAGAPSYVLNLAQYSGDWYVAVAASNDTAVYVYKNPQSADTTSVDLYPAPWRRLSLANPSYLMFSSNTQFLLAESGQNFIVYDFETVTQYHYSIPAPLDAPQAHATWMDGDRLLYVSGGKLEVSDYDNRNRQTLVAANPTYLPFFSSDYKYLFTLKPADATAKPTLTSTPLVINP